MSAQNVGHHGSVIPWYSKLDTCIGMVRLDLHSGCLGCQLLPVDLRHQLLPQHRRHLGHCNNKRCITLQPHPQDAALTPLSFSSPTVF